MGIDYHIKINAFIHVTKKFEIETSEEKNLCTQCKKLKHSKFCDECGGAVELTKIIKKNETNNALKILASLCKKEGVGYCFDIDNEGIICFDYIPKNPPIIVPNYRSEYSVDLENGTYVPFEDITNSNMAVLAIEEIKRKLPETISLFEKYKVPYIVDFGIVGFYL